jgi:hypothetical protein
MQGHRTYLKGTLSFQRFEPIAVTLSLSVAPALADGIPDSGEVMPNGIGESA